MRMLLVRRRLDKMNFAAYHIQGWYRQYRKTWAEKLVQRTKRRTVGVISKVANKVLAKPKAASSKAVSLFRRIAKKPKAESTTSAQPTSETKTRNIFRRAGGFFARAFGLKKKQKSKTAVQPPSAEEAFQRRIQQIESTSETKTTEAEAPARGASKFRAASRKVLPKRKSAFQRAGSFFSRLLRRKAKPQPVHDDAGDDNAVTAAGAGGATAATGADSGGAAAIGGAGIGGAVGGVDAAGATGGSASKFRAASRKVLPKRKSAFQRAGSFFSRLLRRKAKPQPVHDENKVLKSSSNQPGQPMCASLFACRVTQIAC